MLATLRFTTNNDPVSRVIRWQTWSRWSHTELLITDEDAGQFDLPHAGYLGAHLDGGVLLRPLDYDPTCQFILADVDCTDDVKARVIEFGKAQLGKPYDLTAIFGILAHRDWHDPNHWFCSELNAAMFEAAGDPLLRADELDRVPPGLLYTSMRLQIRQAV